MVLAINSAANPLGALVGPAMAAVIAVFVDGDGVWRVAFVVLTIPSVITLIAARRLREPPNQTIRTVTGAMLTVSGAPSDMTFRGAVRRVMSIRTFRRQLVGIGVLGFGIVGILAFFNIYLEEVHGVQEVGRGIIGMVLASASLIGTLIGGNVGERIFEASPPRAVRMVGITIAAFSVAFGFGVFIPNLVVFVAVAWVGMLFLTIGAAPLYAALAAITPPRLRPLMFGLLGLCVALFGGVAGGVIVGAISDATSITVGLSSLAPVGIIGGVLMSRGATTVMADIETVSTTG